MHSSRWNNSGSSRPTLVGTGCGYLMSLMWLLVLGAQLESWLVTSILGEWISGIGFWLARVFSS